jgi:HSP20 family protein
MNLRSLIPLRDRGGLARPEATPFVFGSLQREVDRLFEDFARGLPTFATPAMMDIVPKVDVTESDKEIEITAELPGLERKDVEISVEDGVLTIHGEKRMESEEGNKAQGQKEGNSGGNKNYHLSERSYGAFVRWLQLPPGIDPSSIQATMSNGVLKITIPKPARSQAKKIEVKEAA